jgi:peptidoglycan biosynthesis protein MviN/MurJ (putative lipid II flippase)
MLLMVLTSLNVLAVFAYQWYVVAVLGAHESSDALFASMVIPQLLLSAISGSLTYVLIPILSAADEKKSVSLVWGYAAISLACFGVLALVLGTTASWWVPVTFPGFGVAALDQTITLIRIQLLGMVFLGLGVPFTAAYQAKQSFVYPIWTSVVSALVALAVLIALLHEGGVIVAAWGLTLRSLIQFVLQVPVGFPLSRPDVRSVGFLLSLRKLSPVIVGSSYYKMDQLLDRFLASMASVGMLSLLHLAQQIYGAGASVLANAIASPSFVKLSEYAATRQISHFRREMHQAMIALLGLGTLVFLLVAYPGRQLLAIVLKYGAFGEPEISQLWTIMLALGLVWGSGLVGQVLSQSFYAISDTDTPTKIGVIGFTLGIPLKVAGFHYYGVVGIAIATGLFATGNAIAMYTILRHRIKTRSIFNDCR